MHEDPATSSVSFLRSIYDHSSIAVGHLDSAGVIVDANAALARLFDCPIDALRGRHLHELVESRASPALARSIADAVSTSEPLRALYRFDRADGSSFMAMLDFWTLPGGAGAGCTLAPTQSELRAIVDRGRALLDGAAAPARAPSATTTAKTTGATTGTMPMAPSLTRTSGLRKVPWGLFEVTFDDEGRCEFHYVCPRAAAIYELDLAALRATPERFWGAIHPEDLAELKRAVLHASHTGELLKTEFRYTGPQGQTKWIRCAALPEPRVEHRAPVWSGYVLDITAERDAAGGAPQALRAAARTG